MVVSPLASLPFMFWLSAPDCQASSPSSPGLELALDPGRSSAEASVHDDVSDARVGRGHPGIPGWHLWIRFAPALTGIPPGKFPMFGLFVCRLHPQAQNVGVRRRVRRCCTCLCCEWWLGWSGPDAGRHPSRSPLRPVMSIVCLAEYTYTQNTACFTLGPLGSDGELSHL